MSLHPTYRHTSDKNNLAYLSITKGEPVGDYIYYVIVEFYPTSEGFRNHKKIYTETNGIEKYKDVFSKLRSVAGPYFFGGATQRYSVYKLVFSEQHRNKKNIQHLDILAHVLRQVLRYSKLIDRIGL